MNRHTPILIKSKLNAVSALERVGFAVRQGCPITLPVSTTRKEPTGWPQGRAIARTWAWGEEVSKTSPQYPILGYLAQGCSLLLMSGSVYSEKYQAFLQRLKAARRAAGLTQQAVAEQLNVPQSYVSKCESGERRVDVIELTEFAALYRQSLAYFAYGQDDLNVSVGQPNLP